MTHRATRRIKAVTNRISARSRIAIGQVFLLVAVLWLAAAIGMVPSERSAIRTGRAQLCEAIAVYGSALVAHDDRAALDAALRAIAARNPDVLSAAIRAADGRILVQVGDHSGWGRLVGDRTFDSDIFVPVFANDQCWGEVEIRFKPIGQAGVFGAVRSPLVKLIAFVASVSMVLFLLYLRKMLQHLDPSKVVPTRVRSALDTLAEGLLVVDNRERIVLANQAFATLVGRSDDDLLGSRAGALPWEMDAAEAGASELPWTRALREGQPQRGVTMRLTDAGGARRTFAVNCSPVLGQDGAYRGVLASFDDITQLEQKEVELRKSRDVAESANRAKSEFLARMSHEIRTPMNAILGFADVLRRGYDQSEAERRDYLNTIHGSGQHLLELINDVLDLSKIEAGKLEIERGRCSPHQLITDTLAVLRGRAVQKGIALEFSWAGGLAPETIETDATRLRQVVTNLVGNAIKFTEHGSVRVVARLVQTPGAAPRLRVDVSDSGIGMRPDVLGRVFQPFAQADTSITRRFGGTGLGLSISRQIVEALGGELTVASTFGVGSTFTFTIGTGSLEGVRMVDPASLDAGRASAGDASQPTLRLPAARVLLVEDGASNRKLISLVLQRAGATIDQAEDGKAGADLALRGGYDVILMDMQMPVMDGYTAARLLRERGLTTPIIALTAHAMQGDEEKCRAAGCTGFLTKPIDMDLLVRTVGEAIGTRAQDADVTSTSRAGCASPTVEAEDHGRAARATGGAGMPVSDDARPAPAAPIRSTLPTDDPEFCEAIVEFVDRLHDQLGAMQEAWQRQDLGEVASLAHWLKGSGGTAGFAALTDSGRELEQLAREQRIDEIAGSIESLRELADRIVAPEVSTAAAQSGR